MKFITNTDPGADPSTVAMLSQVGLALLDMFRSLSPKTRSERHKVRKHLRRALRQAHRDDYIRRDLLRRMLDELDQR